MSIQVLMPGLQTTLQSLPRTGYRHLGVPIGGALDWVSAFTANWLVGNHEELSVLEMALAGPKLLTKEDRVIAVCGADMQATIDGSGIINGRPYRWRRDTILSLPQAKSGCRAYLAIAGGFQGERKLGSRSTDLAGGFGGYQGRSLKSGDKLAIEQVELAEGFGETESIVRWYVPGPVFDRNQELVLRVMPGPQFERLDAASKKVFWEASYTVSRSSNRMGCRLVGSSLACEGDGTLPSSGVAPGVIQLPSKGEPIILLNDCGTTGGYPNIGSVSSVDLQQVAQAQPGYRLRFVPIDLAQATELARQQQRDLNVLRCGIALKNSLSKRSRV